MAKESDQKIAKRGVSDHLKAGVKNIKNTYTALYNREGPNGGIKTAPTNIKIIATGKAGKSEVSQKFSGGTRAKIALVGAASVTPLGPIVAMGMGIKKSIDDKKKAKENIRANTPVKTTTTPPKPTPTTSKTTTTTNTKTPTPKPTTNVFSSKTPLTPSKPGGTTTGPKLGQQKTLNKK